MRPRSDLDAIPLRSGDRSPRVAIIRPPSPRPFGPRAALRAPQPQPRNLPRRRGRV